MSQELAIIDDHSLAAASPSMSAEIYLAPALSVEAAVERQLQLQQLVSRLLIPCTDIKNFDGADYGILPGTTTRTLFQPGAEKLALFFGLNVALSRQDAKEEWENGFFFYRYKATAYYNGREVTNIERSCHTREAKYAWVWVETPKPDQSVEAVMKVEGAGRNRQVWKDGRKVWVWQERRPNPDPWSLQFVIEAMAQKRAYVACVKKALGATGFFSKEIDQEDFREQPPDAPDRTIKSSRPVAGKASESGDGGPDSTAFWQRAKAAGIAREDALPIAGQADRGEITWAEAIESLP